MPRPVIALLVSLSLACNLVPLFCIPAAGGPDAASSGHPATCAPAGDPPGPPAVTPPRAETVYYMNKTQSAPNIDGIWDSAAWEKGRMYDLSGDQGKCLMYIMFTDNPGASTRIFIGIDFIADTNSANNGILEIGFDGENDGLVTYENTDPNGSDTGVIWPKTIGGPVVDRWAQIPDGGPYAAGWMNSWCGTVQLWQMSGGYESGDGMAAGFAGHRFYEYSTDYVRNLGVNAGSTIGFTLRVSDTTGAYYIPPGNYTHIYGPFAQLMIAQAPVAGIRSPEENAYYYKGDDIDFDGTGTTDDELGTVSYQWTYDDGGGASTARDAHNFTTTGRHWATLTVTDSDGLRDERTVYFNIKEKNVAPTVVSHNPSLDPVINETEGLTFEVRLLDENVDQDVGESIYVNWTLDGKKVQSRRDYPESSYTFTTDYDGPYSAGQYYMNVTAQDSYDGGSSEPTILSWRVTVVNLNRPPLITMAEPDVDQLSIPENSDLELSIEYLDPDGENVTALWYADNETLPGSRNKGSITWKADFNSSGTHELKVSLSDRSGGVTVRTWTVLVSNVDRAPAISSAAPSQDEVGVREGADLKFSVVTFDPDMEEVSVQWYIDATAVPGATKTTFTFNASFEGPRSSEGSPYTIKVVVRDPFGLSADRNWLLVVEEVNRPPVAIIDEPSDEQDFILGETVRVRGDRSWDPDSADNGSLSYLWDFGDGKTGNGPSGAHKYEKAGPYTVRLTVRDRFSASSTFVNINIRAPVLWVTDILVSPSTNLREDRQVNVTVRVSNTGDADALEVLIKLLLNGVHIATLSIPELLADGKDQVTFTWVAVKGDHKLKATIETAPSFIVPEGSSSEKSVTVKAKPPPVEQGLPAWALGAAGAAVAAVVLGAVGWVVVSRRRKARPASARTADGRLSPEAALATLTQPPPPAAPAGAPADSYGQQPQPSAGAPPAAQPESQAGTPAAAEAGPAAPVAVAPGGVQAEAPSEEPAAAAPAEAEAGTVAEAAPEPAGEAAPAEAVPTAPPAPAALACPSCSEPLEPGWPICPACGAKIEAGAAAAAPTPATPGADAATADAAREFSDAVGAIRKRIEVLTAMDKDVSALQSTLDLATSFHRTGKAEKAQKYLDKAREMLAEMDTG